MAYKSWGFFVEGINVDTASLMPAIFGQGIIQNPNQYLTVNGNNHRWVPNVCIDFPQFSASEIDVLSGQLRAGSAKIRVTANDSITRLFLNQAIARKNVAILASDLLDISVTKMTFTSTSGIVAGQIYYVGEEAFKIDSYDSGTTYNVTRAVGMTTAGIHYKNDAVYLKPTFWVGRKLDIVEFVIADQFSYPVTPVSHKIVWSGFITDTPAAVNSTNTIEINADSALQILTRMTVNKKPLTGQADLTYYPPATTTGKPTLSSSAGIGFTSNVVKNSINAAGQYYKVIHITDDNIVAVQKDYGLNTGEAELGSAIDQSNIERRTGACYEVLVVSKELDEKWGFTAGLSATRTCAFPYHPLTLAAAIIFSRNTIGDGDDATFDVLHANWACGLDYIGNIPAWVSLIEETYWLEVDDIILGADGEEFSPWDYIVNSLLPAFGFQLSLDVNGKIIPIKVGIIDVDAYFNAPILNPLPGRFEWRPYSASILDGINAKIGELPWSDGVKVLIRNGELRDDAGRVSRILNPKYSNVDWPFFSAGDATSVALLYAMERLAWRSDGLPSISFSLDTVDYTPYLGEVIRLAAPDGLLSKIIFDEDGDRTDTWLDVPFICQITSIKPNLKNGSIDVEGLLVLYAYGKYGKWRAPAARIKSHTVTAEYVIEGVDSDWNSLNSDALNFTVGDYVRLSDKALGRVSTNFPQIISITLSGSDYIITLDSEFSTPGTADQWIVLADSSEYENIYVISTEEPYPYAFMTDNATLNRPGSIVDDPDEYA